MSHRGQRRWMAGLALAAVVAGCGPDNGLAGSVGELFALDISRVEVARNDEALQVTYLRNRGIYLDVVVRVSVLVRDVEDVTAAPIPLQGYTDDGLDGVFLLDPDGGLVEVVDVPFARRGWGRVPDGTGTFQPTVLTPGGVNVAAGDGGIFTVPPPTFPVVINEVKAVNSPDVIELFNTSAMPVDVSGYQLSDRINTGPRPPGERFVLPAGSVVQPGSFLLLASPCSDVPGMPGGCVDWGNTFGLGNPGLARCVVTHAPGGEPVRTLPPIQRGDLVVQSGGEVGELTRGNFSMSFQAEGTGGDLGWGRTLSGTFLGTALDAGFGELP